MYTNIIPDSAIAGRPDLKVTLRGDMVVTITGGVLRYDMAPFFQNAFVMGAQTTDGTPLPYPKGTYFWNIVLSPIASTKFQESADKAIAAGDFVAAIFYLYAAPMIEKDLSLPTGVIPNGSAIVPCPNADQLQAWEYNSIVQNIQDQEINTDNIMGFTEPSPTSSVATLENWINNIGPKFGIQGETFTDDQVFGFIYWNSKEYIRSQDVSVLSAYSAQGSSNWWNKYGGDVIGLVIVVITLGTATGLIGASAATTTATSEAGVTVGEGTVLAPTEVGTGTVLADTTESTDIGVDLTGGFETTEGSGIGTATEEGLTSTQAVTSSAPSAVQSAAAPAVNAPTGGGLTVSQLSQYAAQATAAVKGIAPVAKALGIGAAQPAAAQPNPYGYTNQQSVSGQAQPSNALFYIAGGVGLLLLLLSKRKP
jgi:hypothetical protein